MLKIGRRLALLGMLAMTVAMAGCGDDDDPSGPTEITGTYTLRTVNGASLPFTLWTEAEAGFKREITGGSVTLNANGTYSDAFAIRDTEDGVVTTDTETSSGTYVRTGNTIAFTESNGIPQQSATIQNGALIYTIDDGDSEPFVMRLTK